MVDAKKSTMLTEVLKLPLELRELIWAHVLLGPVSTRLLRINKRIYEEARLVLYRVKTALVLTPLDFLNFASVGKKNGRNKALWHLDLAIDCLYLNDHATPGRPEHSIMPWRGTELEVNQRLREWGAIFAKWESFGFTSLRMVHILFRQFAFYNLRFWTRRQFTDPTEFWRLIDTLSSSDLVRGGTEDIKQSGLFTVGACRAFELLVEKKCALDNFTRTHEAGPEAHPGSYSVRDRHYREAIAKVRRRNALTQLELLDFAAYCCKVKLQHDDLERLDRLRMLERHANGGIDSNYATQAHKLRHVQHGRTQSSHFSSSVLSPDSLYTVWKFPETEEPGWTWLDELRNPFPKWALQPNRSTAAPVNQRFLTMCRSATDDEILCSEIFATSTSIDPDFMQMLDCDDWQARIDEAAQSTLYCLCSQCETAAANGRTVPHT